MIIDGSKSAERILHTNVQRKMCPKKRFFILLFILIINCFLLPAQDTLTIASFNLRVFGQSKAEKEVVLITIADIIKKYDIVAIQEIRDKEEKAIIKLLSVVNGAGNDYALVVGTRLGRTNSKEQYAFFYRTSFVEMLGEPETWEDAQDQFEREPFLIMFKSKSGTFDFVLINIHTKPEDAAKEIALLPSVMQYGENYFEESDILCLGDWNADGSYFDEDTYQNLFPSQQYFWMIPNSADTTIAKQSNTYDRMAGTIALQSDWTGEWGVFRFDEETGFKETGVKAIDISDHYPVWANFYINNDTD